MIMPHGPMYRIGQFWYNKNMEPSLSKHLFILLAATTIALAAAIIMEDAQPKPATPAFSPAQQTQLSQQGNELEQALPQSDDIYSCDFWKDKIFATTDFGASAGMVDLRGIVHSVQTTIWDENVTRVYFEISPPQEESARTFYQYFLDMIREGNSVNTQESDVLQFTLGVLENEKIESSAYISDATQYRLQTALAYALPVSLRFVVPLYLGAGAPTDFSFACSIEYRIVDTPIP